MPITLKQDLKVADECTGVYQFASNAGDNAVHVVDLDKLALKTQHAKEFLRFALANALLMDRKQQDYGPRNISKGGTFGCVLRASDKFERLFTLYQSGRRKRAINESIEDTFRDISNYMIIALMVEGGKWANE